MRVLSFTITLVALSLITYSGFTYASETLTDNEAPAIENLDTSNDSGDANEDEETLDVMDTPLDGTSEESFKAGLKIVDQQATEKQYRTLMSALDYLLFYDLDARRKKALLYLSLDGQTPNQVIQTVQDQRKGK